MTRLALALLCCAACTTADRYRRHERPDAPVLTVFVPGYEGTFLYDAERVVWVTPRDALSSSSPPLGSCEGGPVKLEPGGPITRYSAWPYTLDIYDSFLWWGERELPGFTAFGYDWRADLNDTAAKLCALVGDRKANLIAHSMGGIVALLAAARCGEHLEAIVFAGVPFRGAPGALYDLMKGEQLWRNKGLLPPEALWTFPAKWQLLPRTDDFFAGEHVELARKETWAKWPQACPARLDEGLAWRASLPVDLGRPAARTMSVIGKGRPSLAGVRVEDGRIVSHDPVFEDGDGAVTAANATPPFPSRWVFTEASHGGLLNDAGVRETIAAFLRGR